MDPDRYPFQFRRWGIYISIKDAELQKAPEEMFQLVFSYFNIREYLHDVRIIEESSPKYFGCSIDIIHAEVVELLQIFRNHEKGKNRTGINL